MKDKGILVRFQTPSSGDALAIRLPEEISLQEALQRATAGEGRAADLVRSESSGKFDFLVATGNGGGLAPASPSTPIGDIAVTRQVRTRDGGVLSTKIAPVIVQAYLKVG